MGKKLKSLNVSSIKGTTYVPGDKSISHRSVIISSISVGESKVTNLLEGEDVLSTIDSLRKLGVSIDKKTDGSWVINGVGICGLGQSDDYLNLNNSGTGLRLLMGLVSSYSFVTFFTGDASLRKRPMGRVIKPLAKMGIDVVSRDNGLLPLVVKGSDNLVPVTYELPVASAQVKSAIILAALNSQGKNTIIEPIATRDHTELMLKGFGADIEVEDYKSGKKITINGGKQLTAQNLLVPGDPSSAAFLVVAAIITKDSHLVIKNICMNPLRTGLFDSLIEMGAKINIINEQIICGEKVADIEVSSSDLKGIQVPADRAASMIDEYPILSIAASVAKGKTIMKGVSELKVKESNRLQAIYEGLKSSGADINITDDEIIVNGSDILGGNEVITYMDHRIAMSFLILGLISEKPILIDDKSVIDTSFPNFVNLLNDLGANIQDA